LFPDHPFDVPYSSMYNRFATLPQAMERRYPGGGSESTLWIAP